MIDGDLKLLLFKINYLSLLVSARHNQLDLRTSTLTLRGKRRCRNSWPPHEADRVRYTKRNAAVGSCGVKSKYFEEETINDNMALLVDVLVGRAK
jgi:hypothetical protein